VASPSTWLSTPNAAPTVLFGFIRAQGPLEGRQQQIEMQERPGVDGFFVWLKGVRAAPFQMATETDFTSKANALAGYVSACSYVGSRLVLYRYGVSLGPVVLLGVTMQTIQPARSAINGVTISNGYDGVVMSLNWSLRGVS
jgi:hypothetical protein